MVFIAHAWFFLRSDFYGVSSMVRCLGLSSSGFYLLLRFFSSKAWNLDQIIDHWIGWCKKHFSLCVVNGRFVTLGDGVVADKESCNQPGVGPKHKNSGNSGQPNKFYGHTFSGVSLLSGLRDKIFAIPVFLKIHDGLNAFNHLRREGLSLSDERSQNVRMIESLTQVALSLDSPIYGVLDAQYSVGTCFHLCQCYDIRTKEPWVHLITRAKRSYVGYPDASMRRKDRIKLWERFSHEELFTETSHPVSGVRILYLFDDLFWGPANARVRFVWVRQGKKRFLLMTSDLSLDPITCIQLYSLRSKIEQTFKVLKQVIGSFCYRFWTSSAPKLKKKKIDFFPK